MREPLRVKVLVAEPPPPSKELDAQAHLERGLLYVQQRRYREAWDDFAVASLLNPQQPPWQEAVRAYSQAIARNPRDTDAYLRRAYAHERLRQWKEAIDDHSQAMRLAPRRLELFAYRGKAYLRMGRKDKSAEDFRSAGELKPKDANDLAWELVTSPELWHADPSLALELARQATRQAPEKATYWNTLGVAHYRAREWEAAVKALEEAENRDPGRAFSFDAYFLAMCHHQLGETARARDYYDRAVRWCQENRGKWRPTEQQELKAFQAEAETLLGAPPPGP